MQDPAAAERALLAGRSVLDAVIDDIKLFRARAGTAEKPKLDVYFDSMRDLEKNLGSFASGVNAAPACGKEMPPPSAATFQAELNDLPTTGRLFLDVMAMALACGATRVASMMWGGGQCNQPISKFGISDWHGSSHGGSGGAAGQAMINMQAHLAGDWAYFIQKLKSYGVLDQTVTLWGTQNGASTSHDGKNTPILMAGRLGGALVPGGRIIDCGNRNHVDAYVCHRPRLRHERRQHRPRPLVQGRAARAADAASRRRCAVFGDQLVPARQQQLLAGQDHVAPVGVGEGGGEDDDVALAQLDAPAEVQELELAALVVGVQVDAPGQHPLGLEEARALEVPGVVALALARELRLQPPADQGEAGQDVELVDVLLQALEQRRHHRGPVVRRRRRRGCPRSADRRDRLGVPRAGRLPAPPEPLREQPLQVGGQRAAPASAGNAPG